ECGLVTSRNLQLAALELARAEQPRVLDGEGGLGGKGTQEADDVWCEVSGGFADDGETAEEMILADERHREEGAVARAHKGPAHPALSRCRQDVRHLDRFRYLRQPSRCAFPFSDRRGEHRLHDFGLETLGGAR